MSTEQGKTALVTGANAGLGKDISRQLARRPEFGRIYLACRNEERAKAAQVELEQTTGRRIFAIALMDVSDPASVRAGLADVDETVDAVVMNAGGMGGKTPLDLTPDGATYMFAQNVLGHVVLLETLLAEDRLGDVAVYAGSEAARGLPRMGFKRPTFASKSTDELASVIDGSFFAGRKPDVNLTYGQVKLLGILWMASLARRYPDRRFVSVSPGNTTGTHAPDDLPAPLRFAAKHVMPHLGISHDLDVGARRLVDGVTDPRLSGGRFYASAAGKMKGPLVDQTDIYPDLADTSFQDHASEAIHRFIGAETTA